MKKRNSNQQKSFLQSMIQTVLIFVLIFGTFYSCQEDETVLVRNPETLTSESGQLKSATISIAAIDALILKIENYVNDGDLAPGIANALISKLENAKKSLEKGNEKAAMNQLQAVVSQLESLVGNGIVDSEVGEEIIFETEVIAGDNPTFIDARDGKEYKTILIGEQVWMAENLAYETATGSYTWYDQDYENYGFVYGALYDETALKSGKLCPIGWHVSTDDDWKLLEIEIGMNPEIADLFGWRGEVGNLLKATDGWSNDGNGTDNYGFNALPGGSVSLSSFAFEGEKGVWWSPSEEYYNMVRELSSEFAGIYRKLTKKGLSSSVRCVKD